MAALKSVLRRLFDRVDTLFDAGFGPRCNPFHQLGALGWFCYWIVVVSGVYLYIFFDTGITQAYASVEYLTNDQWYAGGVARSLHRYASDALIVVVLIHLVREFGFDRLRGVRWFAWFTGVPLLWFIYACGVTGYWLVWDKLAQYIAIATTEWLDALPFFGSPIARNFLNSEILSGRFFTLMVFMHIALPLLLLLLMWIHVQRHAQPNVNPPKRLAIGTLIMLLALSIAYPAVSQGPADLDQVAAVVRLDWFYLAGYPLLDRISGLSLWLVLLVVTLSLSLLPWIPPLRRPRAAVVDLDNCNGCERCFNDCPFSAVTMRPRTDAAAYELEAVVNPDQCTACGICAGACPTSTPFRRRGELLPGIQIPDLPIATLRERTEQACAPLTGDARVLVYGCEFTARIGELAGPEVAVIALPCVGALPPSFIDFAISRRLADGVLLAGCRDGDCHYRLGVDWTTQRIARTRDPRLRARVPEERLATSWTGSSGIARHREALGVLAARLRPLPPYSRRSAAAAPHSRLSDDEDGVAV